MRRLCLLVCMLAMLAAGALLPAQSSNPISGGRQPGGTTSLPNPMWAATGVVGGIPNITTLCGSQLASSSTSAQINTAITSCSSGVGGVVTLAAGTFNLSGGINMKSKVVLRGQGMATILNFTGNSGANWYWAGADAVITFQGSIGGSADGVPSTASAPSGTNRTWTGTNGQNGVYTQGATVINLGSTPTGLSVGDTLIFWQSDVADATAPFNGWFFSDEVSSNGVSWQGSYDDWDGAMEQRSTVTNISGNAVTINPGLVHPTGTWQASLNPQVRWLTVANTIHDAGLESVRVVTTSLASHQCVICIAFAQNVWIKGVGLVPRFTSFHAGGAVDYGIIVNDSQHVSIANNWIDKMIGGNVTTTSYGVAIKETMNFRFENNIINNVESPTELLVGSMGGVIGYNYERYTGTESQEGGLQQHEVASSMNLVEGNTYMKVFADVYHGNTGISTYFRNHLTTRGFDLWSFNRWYNLIGNAVGATQIRKTTVTDATKYGRYTSFAFRLGYPVETASSAAAPVDGGEVRGTVVADTLLASTTYIWGNYSTIGGSVFDSTEVPTTDAFLPQAVPASQLLPASLYLSGRPGFFTISGIGTQPWPLNGPDVVGGAFLAGHANKTPAQLVYEAAGGSIANFNPGLYGTGSGSAPPGAPNNLRINP